MKLDLCMNPTESPRIPRKKGACIAADTIFPSAIRLAFIAPCAVVFHRRHLLHKWPWTFTKKVSLQKDCNDFSRMAQKPQMVKKALEAQNISFARAAQRIAMEVGARVVTRSRVQSSHDEVMQDNRSRDSSAARLCLWTQDGRYFLGFTLARTCSWVFLSWGMHRRPGVRIGA